MPLNSTNFQAVFSESHNANLLDAELGPDFNANDHSRSVKVMRFGVNEQPLRGYIEGYNIMIVALNVKVRKIQRAKEAKIAILDDRTVI